MATMAGVCSELASVADVGKAFDAPGVLEKAVDFEKELAVIVARNERGEMQTFPTVEMVFHPELNLVEYLFAPAEISDNNQSTGAGHCPPNDRSLWHCGSAGGRVISG